MKPIVLGILAVAGVLMLVAKHGREAKGCIKGAVVGGVAGHYLHHHAVLGAVAGCIVGHHMAHKNDQDREGRCCRQGTCTASIAAVLRSLHIWRAALERRPSGGVRPIRPCVISKSRDRAPRLLRR